MISIHHVDHPATRPKKIEETETTETTETMTEIAEEVEHEIGTLEMKTEDLVVEIETEIVVERMAEPR